MSRSKKLELTWVGKEERSRVEPRILIEDANTSHLATAKVAGDYFDNRLIKGDKLLALKALESEFTGKIKCIFLDPPYNTGSAFEHYDDGVEHSEWLSLIRDRVELCRNLLSDDGSIWVSLDDNEAFHFKVMMDEVFGRRNFVQCVIWHKRTSPANDALYFSRDHDYIFVYAKNINSWKPNRLDFSAAQEANYRNPDNDPRGAWNSAAYTCAKSADERPNLYYPIINPNTGKEIWPKKTRVWAFGPETHAKHVADNMIYWGIDGSSSSPRIKKFLSTAKPVVPRSFWANSDVGHNQEARAESLALFANNPFSSPKPERLLKRVLEIATNVGDLVLDSFAGSGTTGAVAHKMGRRWIMVELGDHAQSHIVPRLRKVIDGTDPGGVTESTGWKGGGGFRFYRLAPSLLERDRWGNWIISREYNPTMLAEAVCKHMGFTYAPSQDPSEYWEHGYSSEKDFIFVTTNALTHEMLDAISYDVGPDRHLLICCKAFSTKRPDAFQNLTLKRIPHAILDTCEWGRDDYSLKIASLPEVDRAADEPEYEVATKAAAGRSRRLEGVNPGLFDTPVDAES